jgi:pyruvate/2-oxoglutarate dehydrogenase complex dihydrolipoamide acyltransferase (E2) component
LALDSPVGLVTPVIRDVDKKSLQHQIAILGINRITEKPIVENKEIKIGQIITLSLTFDHRAVDGALAAKFLDRVKFYLEDPEAINSWS